LDQSINRRYFLKCSGIGLALPLLETPGFGVAPGSPSVKRLVAVGSFLGFHTPSWFPTTPGKGYKISGVLSQLDDLRGDLSIFSGLDHRAPNGHKHWFNYLTGTGTRSVSFDQLVAHEIGDQTRFASLQLTAGTAPAQGQMSFTREGINLPPIGRPSVLFGKLFSSDSDKARMAYMLDSGGSVLDLMRAEAKALQGQVTTRDREKLEEYFTSLREVEQNVQKQRAWLERPTPKVEFSLPEYDPIAADLSLECETIMYELMALALETDSTRVMSFILPGSGQVFTIDGQRLSAGYHGLSHHGNDSGKIVEYNKIGKAHVDRFGAFLRRLKSTKDPDGKSILDSTAVLYGSGMGNANTHNNSNLPILLAGGSYKHGAFHAIDRKNASAIAPLLGDLYLTIMQSMGLEIDSFAKARRNMNEYLV
jgi:hypothetical protein